jgi:hypothetical protein
VARIDGQALDLTAVEFDLLHALVRAEGRVLSRELLIDAVRRSEAAEDIRDGRSTCTCAACAPSWRTISVARHMS